MQTVKQEFSEKLHPGKEFYTSVIDRLICLCVHEKGTAVQKKPHLFFFFKNAYAHMYKTSANLPLTRDFEHLSANRAELSCKLEGCDCAPRLVYYSSASAFSQRYGEEQCRP